MTLWVVVIAVIGCEKNIAQEKRHLLTIGQNQASDLPYEEAVKNRLNIAFKRFFCEKFYLQRNHDMV